MYGKFVDARLNFQIELMVNTLMNERLDEFTDGRTIFVWKVNRTRKYGLVNK